MSSIAFNAFLSVFSLLHTHYQGGEIIQVASKENTEACHKGWMLRELINLAIFWTPKCLRLSSMMRGMPNGYPIADMMVHEKRKAPSLKSGQTTRRSLANQEPLPICLQFRTSSTAIEQIG